MKDRFAVTCNGRAAFYACMWEDIRQCAMDNGWAVALHGSLASDMDIMAMPWVENAITFEKLTDKISRLFKGNDISRQYSITYSEKPHNRIVATIPIFADFYLDISTLRGNVNNSLIEELDSADLFLRNRANSSPAPLNEYDIKIMLHIAKTCDKAARVLEKV